MFVSSQVSTAEGRRPKQGLPQQVYSTHISISVGAAASVRVEKRGAACPGGRPTRESQPPARQKESQGGEGTSSFAHTLRDKARAQDAGARWPRRPFRGRVQPQAAGGTRACSQWASSWVGEKWQRRPASGRPRRAGACPAWSSSSGGGGGPGRRAIPAGRSRHSSPAADPGLSRWAAGRSAGPRCAAGRRRPAAAPAAQQAQRAAQANWSSLTVRVRPSSSLPLNCSMACWAVASSSNLTVP